MAWTEWVKVAIEDEYFPDNRPQWDGAACYELGIKTARGRNIAIMYVGETANLKDRISKYAQNGSHLADLIHDELCLGKSLHYRFQRKDSKDDAIIMQNNLLARYDYPWNYQRNLD